MYSNKIKEIFKKKVSSNKQNIFLIISINLFPFFEPMHLTDCSPVVIIKHYNASLKDANLLAFK